MKTALLASYTKDEQLSHLARLLKDDAWSLLGSAGTAKYLNDSGIACRDVAEIVGPPILGHRVVTLSREIYAGLLATEADTPEIEAQGILWIDLVYVTLYPLEQTIQAGASPAEVIEKTDIGGPTLLRAAAKGRRITLSDPAQIQTLESWMHSKRSEDEREKLVTELAAAAERRVAEYVAASATYWENQ